MAGLEQPTHGSNDPGFSSRPPARNPSPPEGGGGEFFRPLWSKLDKGQRWVKQRCSSHGPARGSKGRTDFPTAKYAQTINSNEGGQGLVKR